MEYKVTINEWLGRTITVEAEDDYEAYRKAKHLWLTEEIVLDADDFVDIEYCVEDESGEQSTFESW